MADIKLPDAEEMRRILEKMEEEGVLAEEQAMLDRMPKVECVKCNNIQQPGDLFLRLSTFEKVTTSSAPLEMDLVIIGKRYPQSTNIQVVDAQACVCVECMGIENG